VRPFAQEDPAKNQLGEDGRPDGQERFLVAFKDSIGQVPSQQNKRDKERRYVPVFEVEMRPFDRSFWLLNCIKFIGS
jgi:hypothetical protein